MILIWSKLEVKKRNNERKTVTLLDARGTTIVFLCSTTKKGREEQSGSYRSVGVQKSTSSFKNLPHFFPPLWACVRDSCCREERNKGRKKAERGKERNRKEKENSIKQQIKIKRKRKDNSCVVLLHLYLENNF